MSPAPAKVEFSVQAHSLWDRPGEKPEVPQVPMMLRRRASLADRMALKTAFDAFPGAESVATVFCSRHGEVQRSVELLELMAKGEGQLPMSFSLSVHNAASGLFGISRGDHKASSSIAAGRDSLAMGVFEACSLLMGGEPRVLLVSYDDALPQVFKPYADNSDEPHALAMLMVKGAGFSLERAGEDFDGPGEKHPAQRLGAFLAGRDKQLRCGAWLWRRQG